MNEIALDPRIEKELRVARDAIAHRGELLSVERLRASCVAFRDRFGPEKLGALDGKALLETMFHLGNRDSLVYWLEFKNDEDFPGQTFGSIAGGSAHKFGLFKRKDTGSWVKGSAQKEENVDEGEAIPIARKYRDQLLAGLTAIEKLPPAADDAAYCGLQVELSQVAPDLYNLAWAHKYFSILYPEKLDNYHNAAFQRFYLIKLLQKPPDEEGLYVCAGRFMRLAARLDWPFYHLSAALNERTRKPIRYWRVGTRLGEKDSIWQDMRNGSYVAIGWDALGDLSGLQTAHDVKGEIRKLLEQCYPGDPRIISRKAGEIRNFLTEMNEAVGDVIVAKDGEKVLGLGWVTGPYRFENTAPTRAPHRRPVKWVSTAEWRMPETEGLRTTVFRLKEPENWLEIERRLLDLDATPPLPEVINATVAPVGRTQRLTGIPGRVQGILERKGQAILYGPPGTGKTYWARQTALDLAALGACGRLFCELDESEKTRIAGTDSARGLVRCCTFHPAYGYEDFIEGFRPKSMGEQLGFTLEPGIFRSICEEARGKSEKYVLLIDEINRGDIPRIFGELLTLLELDKRGQSVILPLSGRPFSVPANLYVLATMNTADRSIALLDTALRRRFGFVELMPDVGIFGSASVGGSIPLGPWLNALNERIRGHLGRDARNLQIGHAYLLDQGIPVTDLALFVRILADDIVPLLEEYCYEDYGALVQILGPGLVDEERQRIREELFLPARYEDLMQALLAPAPEIVTSPEAAAASEMVEELEESEATVNET